MGCFEKSLLSDSDVVVSLTDLCQGAVYEGLKMNTNVDLIGRVDVPGRVTDTKQPCRAQLGTE